MPRKFLFTREEIVEAAVQLTRESGISAVTARGLGERLGTSSKPIFSHFENMEQVQQAVLMAANEKYQNYLKTDMASGKHPPYKASGMAYIRFAREERELFKLLFMRDRSGEERREDGSLNGLIALIARSTGLSEENARRLHLEMWIFVHGVASMLVTGYLNLEEEIISAALTDLYFGQLQRQKEGTK